jgi:hypothetical protein
VTKIRRAFCALGLSCVTLSCALCSRPSLPAGYSIPLGEPSQDYLSERIILVADTHLHNLYGEPVTILRTGLADHIKQSAIRPVQLDFYGQDFLKWVVENTSGEPIVHLGDPCDFSCSGEFEKFVEIMQKTKKCWVYAPGNHDGFFFGNEQRAVDSGDWPNACRNAGEPLTKDRLIRLYLSALAIQGKPGVSEFTEHYGLAKLANASLPGAEEAILGRGLNEGRWRYDGGGRPFLRSISWKIDGREPWKSFVAQELDISLNASSPVGAIMLDTSQYENKPTLIPTPVSYNAGITGEFLADQLDVVNTWIESGQPQDKIWVIMGHYPYDALCSKSQKSLDDLRKKTRALVYISAHTHTGQFIVHGKDQKDDKWLELNIGSLLDWNLEYRTLQVGRTTDDKRPVIRSPRFTMAKLLQDFEQLPVNDDIWEAKPGEDDYCLSHENLKDLDALRTELRLKNALLATYRRLIRVNQTEPDSPASVWPSGCSRDDEVLAKIDRIIQEPFLDKKISLLLELDRFEQTRRVKDEITHQRYRLSQAIWASKYDSVHSRKPLEDDWFIVFPRKIANKE